MDWRPPSGTDVPSDSLRDESKDQDENVGSRARGRTSVTQQSSRETPALARTPRWKRSYCVKPNCRPSRESKAPNSSPERPTNSRAPATPPSHTLDRWPRKVSSCKSMGCSKAKARIQWSKKNQRAGWTVITSS